jgi:drug/metabolite transporter (DMT)-like permease
VKKVLLALSSVYLIWGSTFLAVRYVLESFPPLAMSGARFALAGFLIDLYCKGRCPRPSWSQWRSATLLGILMLGCGTGLVAWAEQTVTSGQAALLNASTPLWLALWALYRHGYPGHFTVAGITLASLGVLTLVGTGGQWSVGAGAIFVASLSWTAATLLSPGLDKPASTVQFSGMTMTSAGLFLAGMSLLSGEQMAGPVTISAVVCWLYLVVAGSLIAMTAYTWLLQNVSASVAATHTYVNPIIAVALSALAGEALPASTPAAVALVVAGVACISLKDRVFPDRVFQTWIPMVGHGHCR